MADKKFDLVVIGTGRAGYPVAIEAQKSGLKTAIIDNKPFGGTCALRGCTPKKVLVGAAKSIHQAYRLKNKGLEFDNLKINWKKLIDFKSSFVKSVPKETKKNLQEKGVATFQGKAQFLSKNCLQVNNQIIESEFFHIAAGAQPRKLKIPGEKHITTSEGFLNLKKLPEKIIFIGGGYISFEFAHIAVQAGSKVIILQRGKRVLKNFDPDLVKLLVENSENIGITIITKREVIAVNSKNKHLEVQTDQGKKYLADLVVHGAGRVTPVKKLNLKKAQIKYNGKGVKVNKYLQSVSNRNVYAAGDAAALGLPLSAVATKQAKIVTSNLVKKEKKEYISKAVPSVLFTLPPLSRVGKMENEIKNKSSVKINFQKTNDWFSSKRLNIQNTGFKTIIDKKTNKILGMHLLGPNADELINLFALAIQKGLTTKDLKSATYVFPTSGFNIKFML